MNSSSSSSHPMRRHLCQYMRDAEQALAASNPVRPQPSAKLQNADLILHDLSHLKSICDLKGKCASRRFVQQLSRLRIAIKKAAIDGNESSPPQNSAAAHKRLSSLPPVALTMQTAQINNLRLRPKGSQDRILRLYEKIARQSPNLPAISKPQCTVTVSLTGLLRPEDFSRVQPLKKLRKRVSFQSLRQDPEKRGGYASHARLAELGEIHRLMMRYNYRSAADLSESIPAPMAIQRTFEDPK